MVIPPRPPAPGRMIRRIEIAIHPADAAYERVYVTQENMNELLSLLRSMETDVQPETEPDIDGALVGGASLALDSYRGLIEGLVK